MNPLKADAIALDDPDMSGLKAYILPERRGVVPGRRATDRGSSRGGEPAPSSSCWLSRALRGRVIGA
ncbi:hypothetical protein [Thiocapsa sp. UBA6158]|uniref:hypothetical protein n=1 Tax=Thiocapsa sp. UBA6158 TaxID=1947692 RepID=UPI0025F94E9D|nr:hypothetical protein [Thiocapsa sp. UBA6158]